ncbi:response regulator transcription factor [Micromonosporaceae bacterium Da 78-11]
MSMFLPPRQAEVLRLLAEGGTDREIAEQLGVSTATVVSHVLALRWTLCARNRTHLVARAYQLGLLDTDRRVSA